MSERRSQPAAPSPEAPTPGSIPAHAGPGAVGPMSMPTEPRRTYFTLGEVIELWKVKLAKRALGEAGMRTLEDLEGQAVREGENLHLTPAQLEATGLPQSALVMALQARGWHINTVGCSLVKRAPKERK